MSCNGMALRLARIADDAGNYLLVPMDHGVTVGPMAGLVDPTLTVRAVAAGGASGVILHKGLVSRVCSELRGSRTGLILHASASTSLGATGDEKVIVASVESALAHGADAYSLHINLGAATEDRMLDDLGRASDECHRLGMPLLAMVYVRGPSITNPFDADAIAHAARLAEELGVDLVKVNYSGTVAGFRKVTEAVSIPVLIAGGEKTETPEAFLQMAFDARTAGARGISVGRNIWQAKDPTKMTAALAAIYTDESTVEQACLLL